MSTVSSSIIGFLLVLMTYYGVNFILSAGMHAYGFSEGDQSWMLVFTIVEIGVVGLA